MKKTLKDFTPEIQAKIPEYIKKYKAGIHDGQRNKDFNFENAQSLMDWNYTQYGENLPVVIVSENPLLTQMYFHIIKSNPDVYFPIIGLIYSLRNKIEIDSNMKESLHSSLYSSLRSSLDSSLDSSLQSSLDRSLFSSLFSSLYSSLFSSLFSSLDSSLYSSLRSSLDRSLFSSLDRSLFSSLESSLDSSLFSSLDSSLFSSLDSSLDSSLRSSLRSSLESSLRSSLDRSLFSSLHSSLYSSLRSSLESSLRSSLDSSLDSSLRSSLDSSLDSSLFSSLESSLDSSLRSSLRSSLDSSLRSSLRSSLESSLDSIEYISDYLFTANIYTNVYLAWYKFIQDEFKISHPKEKELNELNDLYLNSGVYSAVFSKMFCIVTKYPEKIFVNSDDRLHNPKGKAVMWNKSSVDFDQYFINGRNIPAWVFEKSEKNEITKELFLKESNSDVKGAIYEVLGQERMMKMLGARVVDEKTIAHKNGDLESVSLLKTKEVFSEIDNQPFAWVKIICPSTGTQYLQGVEPHHTDAHEAVASLAGLTKDEYSLSNRT